MWSPVEKTALAEAEVEYADIVSTQIDVAFEIVEAPNAPELVGAYAVIWTTTPWTIPVNQAIAYGAEVEYVLIESLTGIGYEAKVDGQTARRLISIRPVAELLSQSDCSEAENGSPANRLGLSNYRFCRDVAANELKQAVARHPMHALGGFFARPRPFLAGDFVTTEQGTGLVHMAPDHGEDDFLLCRANGIDPVFAVEGDGRYRANWAWLGGQGSVINARFNAPDGPICTDLRATGALLAASADYSHSYPHSWRSHAKLIFRATPQWFIPMDTPRDGTTLRETAMTAIADTRWVPERSRNRITAMVAGRPDWVISRQRAWGVPITLFVDRRSGDYLRDAHVDARIVAAVEAGGADAWWATDPAVFLGPERDPADFERIDDILDVWFDSGSTHAFVVEGRYGVGVRADLYVEGSDQHRGWFQSSLLESAGTRRVAPYKAVLTYGMALDAQGKKMSKSVGNVVDPIAIADSQGADILRLWVASIDYFDDVKIGKEVLAGASDAYRKLRNTLRYLLGALEGWDEAERIAAADMPELERWVLHRLAELDAELRGHVANFDFAPVMTAINAFANQDLSAFYFDIRKDSLYCDAPDSLKRRACRTVLDTLFHALVKWLSPVLVFTADEVWRTRFPKAASVHLEEWVDFAAYRDDALAARWDRLRALRGLTTLAIEPARKAKTLGSSLAAELLLTTAPDGAALIASVDFAELAIVAKVTTATDPTLPAGALVTVTPTTLPRCERCRRHLPDVVPETGLCGRCTEVVG